MSVHMQKGKMFIYFSNISFTLTSFYFVFGFNLSCISIKQQRDMLYGKDDKESSTRPLAPSVKFAIGYKDQPGTSKSEDNEVTISEIITSEDESSKSDTTIEIKHNLLSKVPKVKSIIEEDEDWETNNQTPSGKISLVPNHFYLGEETIKM